MASVFYNQGGYEKALGCYQRALEGREKTLGEEHPSTLTTVHNMTLGICLCCDVHQIKLSSKGYCDDFVQW